MNTRSAQWYALLLSISAGAILAQPDRPPETVHDVGVYTFRPGRAGADMEHTFTVPAELLTGLAGQRVAILLEYAGAVQEPACLLLFRYLALEAVYDRSVPARLVLAIGKEPEGVSGPGIPPVFHQSPDEHSCPALTEAGHKAGHDPDSMWPNQINNTTCKRLRVAVAFGSDDARASEYRLRLCVRTPLSLGTTGFPVRAGLVLDAHPRPPGRSIPVLAPEGNGRWRPSGWMPDGGGVVIQEMCPVQPRSGKSCCRIAFDLGNQGWRGVYWLANGWTCDRPGPDVLSLLGASAPKTHVRLVFWARTSGSACVQVKVGGVTRGTYPDSLDFPAESQWISLRSAWERYELDLTGKDLANVQGGLCVVANDQHNNSNRVELFLDDVRFETYAP